MSKTFFELKEELIKPNKEFRQKSINEAKGFAKSASAAAHQHMKTIDRVAIKYSENAGHHAIDTSDHDLAKVHHAHTELANLHHAHAIIHRANGNHEAVEAHEEAADHHHTYAKISTRHHGKNTHPNNLENHEEYDHGSNQANEASREAFKHHPI